MQEHQLGEVEGERVEEATARTRFLLPPPDIIMCLIVVWASMA